MTVITKFSSAKKEHWRSPKLHGSRTACRRKTSGVGANEDAHFIYWVEKYPEGCCSVCLARFRDLKKC